MRLGRLVVLVIAAVVAVAACDRVVDLTPAPDAGNDAAHSTDAGRDGLGPDGGTGDGGLFDGGGVPDGFTGD